MSRRDKHSEKKALKPVKYIVLIICIAVMVFSGYKIVTWWNENKQNEEIKKDLADTVTIQEVADEEGNTSEKYVIDFGELKKKNPDTVAWIKIENTNIEYPVVKAKDNDYYLNRSFDKKKNSAGWIFMDYRDKADGTDRNIVLYGHNRKDKSMFGTINDMFKEEWYNDEKNKYITYITENEYCTYEIFSIYRIEEEDYYITTSFKNDTEFDKFINKLLKRSFRDFKTEVKKEDTILTLSTCSNANHRLAVHARKID